MKVSLVTGAYGSAAIQVDAARTIDFVGHGAPVYAMPMPAGVDATCRARHTRFVDDVATTKPRLASTAQQAGL